MSAPSPDSQQLLAYLQVWRELLERSTTLLAGLTPNPPLIPSLPTGMPGMPPTPPVAAPAPADYSQQLFGYLQAWRQYLEQMAGAVPGSSQQPTTNGVGNQGVSGHPPGVHVPPQHHTGSRGGDRATAATTHQSQSPLRPSDDDGGGGDDDGGGGGGSADTNASTDGSAFANRSAPWPPKNVRLAPTSEGGTFVTDLNGSDYFAPIVPQGRASFETSPQVLVPPVYDYGNQWLPATLRRTSGADIATAPAAPVQRFPAPARIEQHVAGSTFSDVMGRVVPDAAPPAAPISLFTTPDRGSTR